MVRHRAEADRRVRLSEGCKTHFRNCFAKRFRSNRQGIHVGEFALIGCHTGRGVTLHMFDGPHAFARRKLDIFRRDIILEIDKGFDTTGIMRMRNGTEEAALRVKHTGNSDGMHVGFEPCFCRRICTRGKTISKGRR